MTSAGTSSLLMALPSFALDGIGAKTAAVGPLAEAVAHFEYGDWPRAFEALVSLADAGNCEAARLSLLMYQQGARLFGGSFPATGAQRSRWLALSDLAISGDAAAKAS